MVEPGKPLRHTVVVGVLGLKRELLKFLVNPACQTWLPAKAAIRANPLHGGTAIANETYADIVVRGYQLGRAKCRANEVIVEERRPHRQLSLLQRQNPIVMPRRLSKRSKSGGMPLNESRISLASGSDLGKKTRTK